MAINIIQNFQTINPIHDSVDCRISTNNFVMAPGGRARLTITVSSLPNAERDVFLLTNDLQESKFSIKNTPTQPWHIATTGQPGAPATIEAYVNTIANALELFPNFLINFDVLRYNTFILIEAKNDDAVLSLVNSNPGNFSIQFLGLVGNSFQPIYREGFKIIAKLFIFNPLQSIEVDSQTIIPDHNKANFLNNLAFADVYFGESLKAHHNQKPNTNLSTNSLLEQNEVIKRIQVSIHEFWDGQLRDSVLIKNIYSIDAGSPHQNRSGRIAFANSFNNGVVWLHNHDNFRTNTDQPFYLNFSVPANSHFRLRVTFLEENGTEVDFTKFETNPSEHPRVFQFSARIAHLLSGQTYNIHNLLWVKVVVENVSNVALSPEITIYPQPFFGDEKYFLFKNRFGVFEVANARGGAEWKSKHSYEINTKVFQRLNDFKDGNSENVNVEMESECSASFGYQDKLSNISHLDFLNSLEIYEIISNQLYPIKLTSSNADVAVWDENLSAVEFKYSYAIEKRLSNV